MCAAGALVFYLFIARKELPAQKVCLLNLSTTDTVRVDNRNSPQCLSLTYVLLASALSVLTVCVIGFKFLASGNFSSPRAPEAQAVQAGKRQ